MSIPTLLRGAKALYDRGFAVVPIVAGKKKPSVDGWQLARLSWADLERLIRNNGIGGIGVIAGGLSGNLVVLDFDGPGWAGAFALFMEAWPELARAPQVATGSGKRHLWLHCPDMPADFGMRKFKRPDLDCAIELRGNRCNCVVPPSGHPSGGRYSWANTEAQMLDVPFMALQAWLCEWAGNPGESVEHDEHDPVDGRILGPDYWLKKAIEQAQKGDRHERGKWLALQLRATGQPVEVVTPYMMRYADHCETLGHCDEPARQHMAAVLKWVYEFDKFAMRPVVVRDQPQEPPPWLHDPADNGDSGDNGGNGHGPGPTPPAALGVTIWKGFDLLAMEFPEPRWICPEMLPTGLAILGGRPKIGKSWCALQLALAVATGGRFLDHEIERGEALYVALEDSPRRLQGRLQDLCIDGYPAELGLDVAFAWPPLNGAGLGHLETALRDHRLVVVDTLTRAMTAQVDWDAIGQVTAIMAVLQAMAQAADACVLLLDHHRKPNQQNPDGIDDLLGSTGKSAVADTIWAIYRKRGEQGATLHTTGRDIEEASIALKFDGTTHAWQTCETDGGVQGAILDLLTDVGPMTVAEMATRLNKDHSGISRELAELANKGRVLRPEGRRTSYRIA